MTELDRDVIRQLRAENDELHERNERLRGHLRDFKHLEGAQAAKIDELEDMIESLRHGGAHQAGYDAGQSDGYLEGRSDSTTDELESMTASRDYWMTRSTAVRRTARDRAVRVDELRDIIIRADEALVAAGTVTARDILAEGIQ